MDKKYQLEIFIFNGFLKGKLIKLSFSKKSILIIFYYVISNLLWNQTIIFIFENSTLLLFKDLIDDY